MQVRKAGARLPRGHRFSEGVSARVDPRKVQSIVEWATPTRTSRTEVLRFTGPGQLLPPLRGGLQRGCCTADGAWQPGKKEELSEVAAPLTAPGSRGKRRV